MEKKKRNVVIRGTLGKSKIPFSLSLEPEHLQTFRDFYFPMKKELYNDFFPFITRAWLDYEGLSYSEARGEKSLRKLLKPMAAALYEVFKSGDKIPEAVSSFLKKSEANNFRDSFGANTFKTAFLITHVFEGWLKINRISFFNHHKTRLCDYFNPENFYKHSIKPGYDLLKDQSLLGNLKSILSIIAKPKNPKLKINYREENPEKEPFVSFLRSIIPK
jgi:hypothetical protein